MPAIMVVGTTSHAGKSLITAAICRLLKRRGYRVAPFKGQNMALNAFVTADGGEIGHAQAVQAWAAGVEPQVAMNPILLKPQGDMTSQVILNGRAVGRTGAAEYYEQFFDRGWQAITDALAQLQQDYDYIVCEGAGSPAEINLKHRDLTNMRVAKHLQARTLLVADIDRGGVFAHIVGTLDLLEPEERELIRGFAINKFRGQLSLLQSGLDWLEDRTGKPVLGVIPYFQAQLPSEDSLDLFDRRPQAQAEIEIGVVRLPRIANFTDFDPLAAEPSVRVTYWDRPPARPQFDALIIPGSKTTIADGEWLQSMGWAAAIQSWQQEGLTVMGICGGLQLLGQRILDPVGLEGGNREVQGLGLLPIETTIGESKTLSQRQVADCYFGLSEPVAGYEIHQGQTVWQGQELSQPLFADESLGWVLQDRIWGTYLHGLFESTAWRRSWLNGLRDRRGLRRLDLAGPDYGSQRDAALDVVADLVGANLDLDGLLGKF
jgi:adenosylcobyric acid synthase